MIINQKKFKATYHLAHTTFYLAKWNEALFGKFPDGHDDFLMQTATHDPFLRPTVIHYIAVHIYTVVGITEEAFRRTVVCVLWPRRHRQFFTDNFSCMENQSIVIITMIFFIVMYTHLSC